MNKLAYKTYRPLCILACIAYLTLFTFNRSFAQKYAFSHYDIEDGLIESQAMRLCQDNEHRLWIATLGGVSRFDGKDYYSISKANGLPNNFVVAIHADKKGLVWLGTDRGVLCLENKKIYAYPIPVNAEKTFVSYIVEDGDGVIWVNMGGKLFRVANHEMKMVTVESRSELVGNLSADNSGRLHVVIFKHGIYCLDKNRWVNDIPFPANTQPLLIRKIIFDRSDAGKMYLLTYFGVYQAVNRVLAPYQQPVLSQIKDMITSIELDGPGNLWLGTNNGAWRLDKQQQLIHFTEHNGLTNNQITDIFNDRDNNLWFGTSGNGVFKYEQNNYVTYDQSQGTKYSEIIMGIAHDKNQDILLATDGGGLMKLKNGQLTSLPIPGGPMAKRTQSLYTDKNKIVWVGTVGGGVWNYDGDKFSLIKGTEGKAINQITQDDNGVYWFGCSSGCYHYESDSLKRLPGINSFITSVFPIGKDSVLVGTMPGINLVVNKKIATGFKLKDLSNSEVYCMLKINDLILFGTDDKGLFIWNKKTGETRNYNVKDGLKSYIIYSLATDKKGVVWVGTGRGVNRILIDSKNMNCIIMDDGNSNTPVLETNQNSILADGDRMLIGTTKGLKIYNTSVPSSEPGVPYIIIQSVKLFSPQKAKMEELNSSGTEPLKLASNQNHLTISFLGVYLKNPEGVSYQYKLTGLDTTFCLPVKMSSVNYPSLPPGKYTFEVKAVTNKGISSNNTAKFSFEIVPPFYATILFQAAVLLFFVLLGISLQKFFHHRKIRDQRALEAMKREEKIKIRQQTAEDFHDDLGNKLTRISVLTELLNAKIDPGKTDQRNLVEQIRHNVSALYNGTKDILWALDPKSDNLYEMLTHIKEVGVETFQDTPVSFQFAEVDDSLKGVKLTMEYSRNIIMILKELLNNVLKHANAAKVVLDVQCVENNQVMISLADDGSGFDKDMVKRGHGINNMIARAKRINSQLNIVSQNGTGTVVELRFNKI